MSFGLNLGLSLGAQGVLSIASFVTTTAVNASDGATALAFSQPPVGAIDGTYSFGSATLVVSGGGTVFTFDPNGQFDAVVTGQQGQASFAVGDARIVVYVDGEAAPALGAAASIFFTVQSDVGLGFWTEGSSENYTDQSGEPYFKIGAV